MSMTTDPCPFFRPSIEAGQTVILENCRCYFRQQPEAVLVGSGVIVPKSHRATPFELTPEEWNASFDLLQRAKAYLDEHYAPDGYNVGWNVGEMGGQELLHVHMHIIPRHRDEPLAGRGIRYFLKQPENPRPVE